MRSERMLGVADRNLSLRNASEVRKTTQPEFLAKACGEKGGAPSVRWTRWRGKSGGIYELQILEDAGAAIGVSGVVIVAQRDIKGWKALWIGNDKDLGGEFDVAAPDGILEQYPDCEILIGSVYARDQWEAICLDLIAEHKPELNLGGRGGPSRIWDSSDCDAVFDNVSLRRDKPHKDAVRLGDEVRAIWERLGCSRLTGDEWRDDESFAMHRQQRAARSDMRIVNEISSADGVDRVHSRPTMSDAFWRLIAHDAVTECVAAMPMGSESQR